MRGFSWLRRVGGMLAILVLLPLMTAAADDPKVDPPKGWKAYSPKDESFSVWLPDKGGKTSERTRNATVKGKPIKINQITVQPKGDATYLAATILVSFKDVKKIPIAERIEIVRDAVLEETKGKVSAEQDIKQGRVPGKEYLIETKKEFIRLRVFALGGRIYEASVLGTKDQVNSDDATKFLDSYKLPAKAVEDPDKADK